MATGGTTACQNTLKILSFDMLDNVTTTSYSDLLESSYSPISSADSAVSLQSLAESSYSPLSSADSAVSQQTSLELSYSPISSADSAVFPQSSAESSNSPLSSAESTISQQTSAESSFSPLSSSKSPDSLQSSTELSFLPLTLQSPDQSSSDANSPILASSSCLEVPRHKSSPLRFPPCVICGGKASGLHYGCNTCEACKNFFRRYLVRKKGYICPKQNDCGISFTNKSNCSGCRLAKCLELGMSKTKSKLGRYSYNKRTETIKQMKQLEGKKCVVSSFDTLKSPKSAGNQDNQLLDTTKINEQIDKDTILRANEEFDESYIEMLTKAVEDIDVYEDEELKKEGVIEAKCKQHYEKYLLKVNMFGSMNAVSKEEYLVLLKNYGIDIDNIYSSCLNVSDSWKSIIDRYCDFAKALPGFSELSKTDQTNLLKSTNFYSFNILFHNCYSPKYQVFVETDGSTYHLEECADRFFTREITLDSIKIFEQWQKLNLTKEEVALIITVCTFSTDCCRLENYELVEKLQTKYFNLLTSYLYSRYDRATAVRRLSKFLDCLIRMRDVAGKYYAEMNELKNEKLFTDAFPFIDDFTPSGDW